MLLNELLNSVLTARSEPHRKNSFLNYFVRAPRCHCLSQDVLGKAGPRLSWIPLLWVGMRKILRAPAEHRERGHCWGGGGKGLKMTPNPRVWHRPAAPGPAPDLLQVIPLDLSRFCCSLLLSRSAGGYLLVKSSDLRVLKCLGLFCQAEGNQG